MENKNVVIVKHHPRPITLANSFYTTQCPDIVDRIVINLTSRNPDRAFAQQVSPFYVGPVTGPDGASSDSLEIFWQVGKVFPHHDDGGQPSEAYFQYRDNMYSKKMGEIPKPVIRHPYCEFGYEADDMLYWSYWNSEKGEYEKLSYLEARKKVYIPQYAKLVANNGGEEYSDEVHRILKQDYNYSINMSHKKAPTNMAKLTRIEQHAPTIRNFYFLESKCRDDDYRRAMVELTSFSFRAKNLHDDALDSLAMLTSFISESPRIVTVAKRPF